MKRRLVLLAIASISLFFVATTLYLGRDRFAWPLLPNDGRHKTPEEPVLGQIANGTVLPSATITQHLEAILDPWSSDLPTLECPAINTTRYDALRDGDFSTATVRYFFALNLRQTLPLLPRLMGSIVEAIRFLGPEHCALSIVEGHSPDGTADVLAALGPALKSMGTPYYFASSEIDPGKGERIARLAALRNLALAPLFTLAGKTAEDAAVVFLNDVSACPEDILELLHQKRATGADMTCAMDWTYVGRDPTFYDVWVARNIHGDSFFNIPPDGSWDSAWNLFWNAEETRARFFDRRPFQVFSCWNGAVAFTAQPILQKTVRFRAADGAAGECEQGEPQLFCKDLWFRGYRKIAVVPSVNLEYSVEKGRMIKAAKGFTGDAVSRQDASGDMIDWRPDPPEKVKCMPSWDNQFWQWWNETLKP
ncbi:alpha-1,3-mannosyltransferase CMT1 [Metarhizium anisopliae]